MQSVASRWGEIRNQAEQSTPNRQPRTFQDSRTFDHLQKTFITRPWTCFLSGFGTAVGKAPQSIEERRLEQASWCRNSTDTAVHKKINHKRRCRTIGAIRKQKLLKVQHERKLTNLVGDRISATIHVTKLISSVQADFIENDIRRQLTSSG